LAEVGLALEAEALGGPRACLDALVAVGWMEAEAEEELELVVAAVEALRCACLEALVGEEELVAVVAAVGLAPRRHAYAGRDQVVVDRLAPGAWDHGVVVGEVRVHRWRRREQRVGWRSLPERWPGCRRRVSE